MNTTKTVVHVCSLLWLSTLAIGCVDEEPREAGLAEAAATTGTTTVGEEGSDSTSSADADPSGTASDSNSGPNPTTANPTGADTTVDPSSGSTSSASNPGETSIDPPSDETTSTDTGETTDDPPPPPPPPDCVPADDHCDGDKLVTCENGEEEVTLCSQSWCAAHGLGNPLGCGYKNGEPGCQCAPALECTDGESECTGPDSGKDCIDGSWSDPLSCDTYCQQNGADLSLSCTQIAKTAVCDCRYSCNPAVDEFACSQDQESIFQCENVGAWSLPYDCDDVCQADGYNGSFGCGWFPVQQQFLCSCY